MEGWRRNVDLDFNDSWICDDQSYYVDSLPLLSMESLKVYELLDTMGTDLDDGFIQGIFPLPMQCKF